MLAGITAMRGVTWLALLGTSAFGLTLVYRSSQVGQVKPEQVWTTPSAADVTHQATSTFDNQADATRRVIPAPAHIRLESDQLEALLAAGIASDDSEQRSLAIQELAQAPQDQLVEGLTRILTESHDRRSRLAGIGELVKLPPTPDVLEPRAALLAELTRDTDAVIADAALSALDGYAPDR